MTSYLGVASSSGTMTTLKGRPGDYCVRTDQRGMYILTALDASIAGNWIVATAGVRTSTLSSGSAPTPAADTDDVYTITALSVTATIGAPTGTVANGQRMILRIKDNGTPQTLNWNAIWRGIGVTLPAVTVASQTLYVVAHYNSTDTKWDVLIAQSG